MELPTLGAVAATVGSVGAIVAGAWTLWRKALKPMFDIISSRYRNLNAIPQIQDSLKLISEQLVPNGGTSLRDAVDRLEANQVLMASKQRVMLETSRITMMTVNAAGMVTDVSEPLCEMLDRSREDLLGNNWISVVHPEDREDLQNEWDSAVDCHRNIDAHFRFMVNGEHECVGVYLKASALPPVKNKPSGYLAVIARK